MTDFGDVMFVAIVLTAGAVAFHYLGKPGTAFTAAELNVGGELVLAAIGLLLQSAWHPAAPASPQLQGHREFLACILGLILVLGAMLLKGCGYTNATPPELTRRAALISSSGGLVVLAFAYFASNYSIAIQGV